MTYLNFGHFLFDKLDHDEFELFVPSQFDTYALSVDFLRSATRT